MLFRKTIIFIFIFAVQPACLTAGELIPLLENGDVNSHLNWVIVGDGFRVEQKVSFEQEARRVMNGILSKMPWRSYQELINVFAVFVPSDDSGADKRCGKNHEEKNTKFDAVYDFVEGDEGGGCRLLSVNEAKVFSAVIPLAPYYDNILVLVNDTQYGGSGGSVVTFSSGSNAIELALHELGHVIANLADEYETPYHNYPPGDFEPNVTFKRTIDKIPWNTWIKPDTLIPTTTLENGIIGLFEGARYLTKGIYRPKHICKMRTLGTDFCEICKEAQILSIYRYVEPIKGKTKNTVYISGGLNTFHVDMIRDTGKYNITWLLDGKLLAESGDSIQIDTSTLPMKEEYILTAIVKDNTNMVRTEREKLVFTKEWKMIYKEDSTTQGETDAPLKWEFVLLFLLPVSTRSLSKRITSDIFLG